MKRSLRVMSQHHYGHDDRSDNEKTTKLQKGEQPRYDAPPGLSRAEASQWRQHERRARNRAVSAGVGVVRPFLIYLFLLSGTQTYHKLLTYRQSRAFVLTHPP
jgi:hypothetical protein